MSLRTRIENPGRWLLPVALCTFVAPFSAAQQEEPLDIISEVIEVRVVNVEVVVTDKQGERVTDLPQDSFRLLVDGEEVPIAFFSEIQAGEVKPSGVETTIPGSLEAGQSVGTNYLVFIDDQFSIARDRNRVLEKLTQDLADLTDADQLAVVAYDGSKLERLTDWTSSRQEILEAFEAASERRSFGLSRLGELRQNDSERQNRELQMARTNEVVGSLGSGGGPLGALDAPEVETFADPTWGRLSPVEYNFARSLEEQLKRSVAAAVATMRSLEPPLGRRVLVLLAGGWTFSPAEYAVASYDADPEQAVAASMVTHVVGADGCCSGCSAVTGSTLVCSDRRLAGRGC